MAMMQTGRRLLRNWSGCEAGATALEFAFALPVMLMLILGMLEVAMVMFVSVSVEGGLREAARFGITGQTPASGTREEAILAIIDRYTFGVVDIAASDVSFKTYDSFTDVGQPEPFTDANANGTYDAGESFEDLNGNAQWDADRGAAGVGNAGSVVLYEVSYDWELLTPYLAQLLGDAGVFHMSASIAVRNEPYGMTGGS